MLKKSSLTYLVINNKETTITNITNISEERGYDK